MVETGPQIGTLVLDGQYQLLQRVQGSLGGGRVKIGTKGACRYCGCTDSERFRKDAHTFPEALGNKWVFSNDECDDCNMRFATYDDALASGLSPFLTLGGVKGKHNQVRQTGRTGGRSAISQQKSGDQRGLVIEITDAGWDEHLSLDPTTGTLRLDFPVAGVRFKPRNAYKAVAKMGMALLPRDELGNFQKLRMWLLDANDSVDFPVLEVALSLGSIGNAPRLASGTLLRRVDPAAEIPYMLFILSAGSVCLQIDLMPDSLDNHILPIPLGTVNITWLNVIGDEEGQPLITIPYSAPMHLNWSSREAVHQPIESMRLDFDPRTTNGHLTPIFRS